MAKKVCAPGLNVSVILPDEWFISPRQPKLNPFALPNDVYDVGEFHLLSSALAITDTKWFHFTDKDYSPEELLFRHHSPEVLNELNLKLLKNEEYKLEGCACAEKVYYDRIVKGYPMKLIEIHVVQQQIHKNIKNFRVISISCSTLAKEYAKYKTVFEDILSSINLTTESGIGLCFDIKKIDACPASYSNYAHYARDLFIQNINSSYLSNSILYWGDVLPDCKYFCIKLETTNPETCPQIRKIFSQSIEIDELAPLSDRFLTGLELEAQPLLFVGKFDQADHFIPG